MPLICRCLETLAFEHMAQVAATCSAGDLHSATVCISLQGVEERRQEDNEDVWIQQPTQLGVRRCGTKSWLTAVRYQQNQPQHSCGFAQSGGKLQHRITEWTAHSTQHEHIGTGSFSVIYMLRISQDNALIPCAQRLQGLHQRMLATRIPS